MNNTEILYKDIKKCESRMRADGNKAIIKVKEYIISGKSINQILGNIIHIKESYPRVKKITIKFKNLNFYDDAVLNVLECILYDLLKSGFRTINLDFENKNPNPIAKQLYEQSLIYNNDKITSSFLTKFEKKKDIGLSYYRAIVKNDGKKEDISNIYTDIPVFLNTHVRNEEILDKVAEVVAEVVGNARDHSNGDCLLNLKVFDVVSLKHQKFKLLSVVALNISDIKIYTKLKEQIENNNFVGNNKIVDNALEYHKKHFDSKYVLDVFAFLSTFQKSVTTRDNSEGSGGTGLTTLINFLIEQAYDEYCYVNSGYYSFMFKKDCLKINDDGTIGFNDKNDYYTSIPSEKLWNVNTINFNGTIYNLDLLLKGDMVNE